MRAPSFSTIASILVSAVALFGVASCSTTVASAPSQPAYDTDVRPIFMAHCVRCHGGGDSLNVPTEPTGPNAAVPPNINVSMFQGFHCFLDRYPVDNGQCGTDGGAISAACSRGALYFKDALVTTLTAPESNLLHMPPAPAPNVDDWEKDVITNWVSEKPTPICSNSSDPDPTICPPGS